MGSYTRDSVARRLCASRKLCVKCSQPPMQLTANAVSSQCSQPPCSQMTRCEGDGCKASRGWVGLDLGVLAPWPLSVGLGVGILPSWQGMGSVGIRQDRGIGRDRICIPNCIGRFFLLTTLLPRDAVCSLRSGLGCSSIQSSKSSASPLGVGW